MLPDPRRIRQTHLPNDEFSRGPIDGSSSPQNLTLAQRIAGIVLHRRTLFEATGVAAVTAAGLVGKTELDGLSGDLKLARKQLEGSEELFFHNSRQSLKDIKAVLILTGIADPEISDNSYRRMRDLFVRVSANVSETPDSFPPRIFLRSETLADESGQSSVREITRFDKFYEFLNLVVATGQTIGMDSARLEVWLVALACIRQLPERLIDTTTDLGKAFNFLYQYIDTIAEIHRLSDTVDVNSELIYQTSIYANQLGIQLGGKTPKELSQEIFYMLLSNIGWDGTYTNNP